MDNDSYFPPDYRFHDDPSQVQTQEPEDTKEPTLKREDFIRYSQLLDERDAIEEEIKTLGVKIKGRMEEDGEAKMNLPGFGTLSIITVPRWKYSEEVEQMQQAVKEQQEEERSNGKAQNQATSSLRFTREK